MKNNIDTIVLDNNTYYILYENGNLVFLKEDNGKYTSLSEEESLQLKRIYEEKLDDFNVYEKLSSSEFEESIRDNTKIKENDWILGNLRILEQLIPEDSREIFYQNVKSLKFNFDKPLNGKGKAGRYDPISNTIYLDVRTLIPSYLNAGLSESETNELVSNCLFHEMLHMASTIKTNDNEVNTGFASMYPGILKVKTGLNFNEGVTEALTQSVYTDRKLNFLSGYLPEICIASHIFGLVGRDKMLESYFNADGLGVIKGELSKYASMEEVDMLFMRIEANSLSKNEPVQTSTLSNIEQSILDMYEVKMENDIISGKITSSSELELSLESVNSNLLDSSRIELYEKNYQRHLGLDEISERYEEMSSSLKGFLAGVRPGSIEPESFKQ